MSTPETEVLPAGTWSVDRVHSTVGFAVEYMAGTFTGPFSDFDANVSGGVLKGPRRSPRCRSRARTSRRTFRAPTLRRGTPSEQTLRSSSIERKGDELMIDAEITIKRHTEPVEIDDAMAFDRNDD